MKKKSMVSNQVLYMALGISAALLIIWILVGPEKLLAQVSEAGFSFGLGQLPEERPDEFTRGSSVPNELVEYFNRMANNFANYPKLYKNQDPCLIPVDKFESKGNHFIILSKDKIKISEFGQGGSAPTGQAKDIPGFSPCMVYGDSAGVFYNNWIEGKSDLSEDKFNKDVDEEKISLLLKSDDKIITNGLEHTVLRKPSHYIYLYKVDDRHFCFISAHDGSNCNADGGTVEKGCVEETPPFGGSISMCEDLRLE